MMSFKIFINEKYDFSSVHVILPDSVAKMIVEYGMEISEAELHPKGREDRPHITVKYGLHSADPGVLNGIALPSKINAVMGDSSIFSCDEFDVVKIDIQSPDLITSNAMIVAGTDNTNTHPEYHAHATVAYLLPGQGAKYIGDKRFNGISLVFDEVEFSGHDEKLTTIKL